MFSAELIVICAALFAGGLGFGLGRASGRRSGDGQKHEMQQAHAVLDERLREKSLRCDEFQEKLLQKALETERFQHDIIQLTTEGARLKSLFEAEGRAASEKIVLLTSARSELEQQFKALSSESLKSNNKAFLELATETLQKFQIGAKSDLERKEQAIQELVKPVRDSLEKFDSKVQEMEKARVGAYEGLNTQLKALAETNQILRAEASNLVRALGTPRVRGRWGEIQLRRVVEIAGMLNHCDFFEQQSVTTEEGRLRPDLIVRLPGGKNIVVDAKAPLAAYLEALESTDEAVRKSCLANHCRQIRDHVAALGRKSYWEQFQPAPEFVILFLPGESFFSAALESDPSLIELGVGERVLLATPTTLITLLKAVAYGWQQEQMTKNAADICALGKDLYQRIRLMGQSFGEVGSRLGKAVESYNKSLATLESRVLVTARKFEGLEVGGETVSEIPQIESMPREMQTPELRLLVGDSNSG